MLKVGKTLKYGKSLLAGAVTLVAAGQAVAQPTLEELQAQIDALAAALEAQKAEEAKSGNWFENTTLGGYGEHHWNHLKGAVDANNNRRGSESVDAHRFVLFINHSFNDKVKLFSELEVEHGLVKDTADGSGPGEVELEQAYIDWQFADRHHLKMGQFLIPVGLLNETHEPDTFYGVERNNVEKNIIPTTWWETGVMLSGEVLDGLNYDLAVHTGLENSSFNIRSGRQKSAKANGEELAYTARLVYRGISGLELGVTGHWQQDMSQNALADADEPEARLLETHLIYQTGPVKFTALKAQWDIRGQAAEAAGKDEQVGQYAEISYKITDKLGIFGRYSEWDNEAGNRLASADDSATVQRDWGINYWLAEQVVVKFDVQHVSPEENKWISDEDDSKNDGVNLGIGWSF